MNKTDKDLVGSPHNTTDTTNGQAELNAEIRMLERIAHEREPNDEQCARYDQLLAERSLSSDTLRSIKAIRRNGYYTQSQTLGEGGWTSIANEIANWKTYRFYSDTDGSVPFDDIIKARNDMAAMKAFRELYDLRADVAWHISEVITTQRIIAISDATSNI